MESGKVAFRLGKGACVRGKEAPADDDRVMEGGNGVMNPVERRGDG
jgi:hypothetical protein